MRIAIFGASGFVGSALTGHLIGRSGVEVAPYIHGSGNAGQIARFGFPLTAVMRPLDNPLLNEFVEWPRKSGGLSLVYKKGAMESAEAVLDDCGTLCFIADQDAGRKGVFADFFGRAASWYKSIGLLAMHKRVPIIVGQAARMRKGFHYRVEVLRIIRPDEWDRESDPLRWITQAFAAALEEGIRRFPEQYLWVHRRWKTRPRDEENGTTEAQGHRETKVGAI